jgi:hypothetical protein
MWVVFLLAGILLKDVTFDPMFVGGGFVFVIPAQLHSVVEGRRSWPIVFA